MAAGKRYVLSAIGGTTVVGDITQQSLDFGQEVINDITNGLPYNTYVGTRFLKPSVTFSTKGTALASTIHALSAGLEFHLQLVTLGGLASGSGPIVTFANSLLYLNSLSCDSGGDLEFSYTAKAYSTDGSSPIALSSGATETLPASARYGLGTMTLAGITPVDVTKVNIDAGVQLMDTSSDGLVYPNGQWVSGLQPKATIDFLDISGMAALADIEGNTPGACTLVFKARDDDGYGTGTVTATIYGQTHVKNLQASSNGAVSGTVEITSYFDGTHAPLAITVA